MLTTFVRSTMHEKKDYVVMARNDFDYFITDLGRDLEEGKTFPLLTDRDIEFIREYCSEKRQSGHACVNETSIMLAIDPEHVRMDRVNALSGLSTHEADYIEELGIGRSTRFWLINHPNSYNGEMVEGASATIGQTLLNERIKHQAEICRRLKADDRVLEWNDSWNKSW